MLGRILTMAGHHCTELPSMKDIVMIEKSHTQTHTHIHTEFCSGHFLPDMGMVYWAISVFLTKEKMVCFDLCDQEGQDVFPWGPCAFSVSAVLLLHKA